ncbi:peptide chain release factor H [Mucilaginibacter sp. OK098]|uniref:peptide chain release factor H n=1 Tax=Mucilaginibacter sp. OK098 TaxID=1855297 RepID=UPI000913C34F|nr:peptide chain release factor H [Mucilaginibacter sp. OK098]SHM52671.1 peptide chain release factor [Mucilaginibacter sp. OK098]
MKKVIIQITSGKGPAECCRVVALVQQMILKQAKQLGINTEVLENVKAENEGALLSATLMVEADNLDAFITEWQGTIQWIAQSPFRKYHKRKNWFVGVAVFDIKELAAWDVKEVKLETCRASGPGGQNVNKVETAVRGLHVPSGIQVQAMDSRSQLENKKICIARLQAKVLAWQTRQLVEEQQGKWLQHHSLQRGNPVKILSGNLF